MSKKQLFVALLSLLICTPTFAGATSDSEISAAQEQDANGNGLTNEAISRELELFRGAEVSLRQALKIADSLHPCVYRKLKHGRSGDEVHPGWCVN
jgi:uncharacterized protein YdeI (BOF family)